MDNIILTLHPITAAAWTVLKDPRNANLLVQVNTNNYESAASQGEPSAFSLTLDRAPKTGPDFIIGRHRDADIVLRDPASSARHCIISINDTGVPFLFEQSTNGTLINGKHCKNQSFEIQGGMQVDIRDAAFKSFLLLLSTLMGISRDRFLGESYLLIKLFYRSIQNESRLRDLLIAVRH